MEYLAESKALLENLDRYKSHETSGCSAEDISKLEAELGYKLPAAYIEFLTWMGSDFKGVFKGSDWFLCNVIENNELLPELLMDNNVEYSLEKHYLCFFSHQGYIAAWFNLPCQSQDPEVWYFTESGADIEPKIVGTFSDFLHKVLLGLIHRC